MAKRNSKVNSLTPSSLEIVEELKIGKVEYSETKAISVSLIRTAIGYCYIAIYRMNRNNLQSDWTQTSKIWIPFDEGGKVTDLINRAYILGLTRGWKSEDTVVKNYSYFRPTKITSLMIRDTEEAILQEALKMTGFTRDDIASFEWAEEDDPKLLAWNFAKQKARDYIYALFRRESKNK